MKSSIPTDTPSPNLGRRPEERLLALQESHGLTGEPLNAWCRERGVFAHQLIQWKSDFCTVSRTASGHDDNQTLRSLKADNQQLSCQKAINRKATAETE